MNQETDVLIIGAAICGSSIARELSQYNVKVTVIEKSLDSFNGQSKGSHAFIYNGRSLTSGASLVLKSMIDPDAPLWDADSEKMRFNIRGYELFCEMADRLEIPYIDLKAVMLAHNEEQAARLDKMYDLVCEMGIQDDVQRLTGKEMLEMEPSLPADVVAGLYSEKHAKVTYPFEYVFANVDNARDNGVEFHYGAEVIGIEAGIDSFEVKTTKGTIRAKYLVNAAGAWVHKVAEMAGAKDDWDIVYYKTQCVLLDRARGASIKTVNQIMGPPTPGFVEGLMMTVHGNPYIYCGAYNKEEDPQARETREEWWKENIEHGKSLMAKFTESDMITAFTGVRAFNTRDPEESIIEFSKSCKNPNFLNVAMRLPGYTFSAAVAKHVVDLLGNQGVELVENVQYNPYRKAIVRVKDLTTDQRAKLIKKDGRYGRIICKCESVTEGEIVEAIKRGARTIQGVAYRTRAGLGRCQRNWCGPQVLQVLARETGLPLSKISKHGLGSAEVFQ
jgi:glycerol-3-phosphate dehydrogenase